MLYLDHVTYQHNSERSGQADGATIADRSSYSAGAAYRGEGYTVSTSAEIIISKTETSKHYQVAAQDSDRTLEGRIIYSMYDRKNGTRTDFVKVDAGKSWTFEKVGTVKVSVGVQKSLLEESKGVAMALDASWRPE